MLVGPAVNCCEHTRLFSENFHLVPRSHRCSNSALCVTLTDVSTDWCYLVPKNCEEVEGGSAKCPGKRTLHPEPDPGGLNVSLRDRATRRGRSRRAVSSPR